MRILITGGTSFVSRYAAEYFVAGGHDVTVLNRGTKAQPEGAKLILCDRTKLCDRLRGERFDLVFDITAYTEEHIKTLIDSGVKFGDYIFVSSSAVYPETNEQPFTEEQSCGYNSVWGDYGMNKLKAERYLRANAPDAFILRPPYLYGKYDNLYREAFVFDCAMSKRPFYIPLDGEMRLQFFNVADLCRFACVLLAKMPSDRVFNVGNRETVSVREWAELCYGAAGRTPELRNVPASVPQREYFPFRDYEYALDVTRQNELMPDTVSLEQGLKAEFEWYKDNADIVDRRRPYTEYIDTYLTR